MKKHLFSLISALAVVGWALTGCNPTPELNPSAAISVKAGIVSATVTLTTSNLSEYAYSVSEPGSEITDAAVLFAKGTTGSLTEGDNTITVSGLEGGHKYTIAVALKMSESEFYSEVLTANFTTSEYVDALTLVNTTYDGFTVHFKMPDTVQEGNVVKYGVVNLAMYNENKLYGATDATQLNLNDEVYGQIWEGDATLTYNDDNIYKLDENGNPVEMWGEPVTIHDKIAPGEPLVFLVGEFSYGDSSWGWGEGYYVPLFDEDGYYDSLYGGGGDDPWGPGPLAEEGVSEDDFWTGFHDKIYFTAKQPELLDAEVKVEVTPTATGGTIKITPDEEVFQYCYFLCDDSTYEMMLSFLDNNENYLQWFVTSAFGYYAGCQSGQGAAELVINEFMYVEPEMNYHFIITAMGNEDGTVQNFQHIQFVTPAKSGKAPEVEVTAVKPEEASPFAVYFNVKCPSKNAASGKYAANYTREWELSLNNKWYQYTYDDLVGQGFGFSEDEIALINSDEGLTLSFATVPDEVTRLAVLLYNDEDTPNTISGAGDSAVADSKSDRQPDAPKVDSPLFSALLGEWTMTGEVTKYDYYEGYVPDSTRSCKITIADKVIYPETLPESVYDLYEGKDREYVDGLYDEFKEEAEIFNAWLKGQNRLLCLGFGYADNAYYLPGNGIYKTPYDLFTDADYSSYDNKSLFWDFGPKWYLEVAADGSVSVPFNDLIMYPMSGWTISYPLYMAAYGADGVLFNNGGATLAFPVDVASDNSTVTVNPILDGNGNPYYPACGFSYYGGFRSDDLVINSALTLTKGWTEPETPVETSKASKAANGVQAKTLSESASAIPMLRKTTFKGLTEYKKVSCKVVDKEQFISNIKNARNSK